MTSRRLALALVLAPAALCLTALPRPAAAQGWLQKAKDKAKAAVEQKTTDRVAERAGQGADAAMNAAEGAVKCAASDAACIRKAREGGKQVTVVDATGAPVNAPAGATGAAGAAVNANSDFLPGTRVIVAEDFAHDNLGDFPRGLELKQGNMEVATYGGARYLRNGSNANGTFEVRLPEVLPQQFTLEFTARLSSGNNLQVTFDDPKLYYSSDTAKQIDRLSFVTHTFTLEGHDRQSNGAPARSIVGRVVPVQVMADGHYVKVYIDGTRVGNVPNATLGRSRRISFTLPWAPDSIGVLVGNIRVAAGGRDLYKALASDGRVTADGILFDTNSDRLRPESTPALKEIADLMTAHPDVRLSIEGHTDNVGSAAANKALSAKRAAAVMASLTSSYGIAASRLTSAGFGDTKPAAPNDTPEGRAKNRRVELVKMN